MRAVCVWGGAACRCAASLRRAPGRSLGRSRRVCRTASSPGEGRAQGVATHHATARGRRSRVRGCSRGAACAVLCVKLLLLCSISHP